MNVVKRIVVGSIILLLLMPVFVVAEVNYSTHTTTTGPHGPYSLGDVYVKHWAFFYNLSARGARMIWVPPENLTFEFNEINGTVMMNFYITIHHRLEQGAIPILIAPRYTLIDHLWISSPSTDYFNVFNETKCTNQNTYDIYTIYLTPDIQTKPLETNGQQKNLTFWVNMGVDAGRIKIPMPDGTILRFGRYYSNRGVIVTNLKIVPVIDPKI
jgi:hypothetical protein